MTSARRAHGGCQVVGSVSSAQPQAILGPATATMLCFELATRTLARLDGAVTAADEVQGFRYFGDLDLLGFVNDGTSKGLTAAAAALIGGRDPEFEGGTFAVVQKYLHDLPARDGLSVQEQERIIGRAKRTNRDLGAGRTPSAAHRVLATFGGLVGDRVLGQGPGGRCGVRAHRVVPAPAGRTAWDGAAGQGSAEGIRRGPQRARSRAASAAASAAPHQRAETNERSTLGIREHRGPRYRQSCN
jgi:Dyp-type peroxidase family